MYSRRREPYLRHLTIEEVDMCVGFETGTLHHRKSLSPGGEKKNQAGAFRPVTRVHVLALLGCPFPISAKVNIQLQDGVRISAHSHFTDG